MEQTRLDPRRVPFLATIISLLVGFGSLVGLLGVLHLAPHRFHFEAVLQLSAPSRSIYAVEQVCQLAGAALLWKMKPLAAWFLSAAMAASIALAALTYGSYPHHRWELGGFAFQALIVGYVWWITRHWQSARVPAVQI